MGNWSDLDLVLMHNRHSLISFSRKQRKQGEDKRLCPHAKGWRDCLLRQLDVIARLAGKCLEEEAIDAQNCLEDHWSVLHNKGKFKTFLKCQKMLRAWYGKEQTLGMVRL